MNEYLVSVGIVISCALIRAKMAGASGDYAAQGSCSAAPAVCASYGERESPLPPACAVRFYLSRERRDYAVSFR